MTTPQLHDYTIDLHPTPAQADTLRRLGHAADHARAMAYDLAALGQLTASTLPELPRAPYVPDHRAIAADVDVVRQLVPLRDVPVDVLHAAVAAGQRAFAHGRARTSQDGCITGDALLAPALDGVMVAGVTGVVRADLAQLPRWAAAVWRRAAGDEDADPTLDVRGAVPTTYGHVALEGGQWLVDVMIRWDAHPEGRLRLRWEDELSPERQGVAHLMGWSLERHGGR